MIGQRRKCAIIGLPAVGKSSLVAAWHGRPGEAVQPTQGCNKSTISRGELYLDLLDLGGQDGVRKFWPNLTQEADALICLANASEADDLAWAMLGSEIRNLRDERPVLLLLNQRNVAPRACASTSEALERLNLRAGDAGVHVETLASSSDTAGAEAGLEWLCDVLVHGDRGEQMADDDDDTQASRGWQQQRQGQEQAEGQLHPWSMPEQPMEPDGAEPPMAPPAGGSRLRVIRELRNARQQAGSEDHDLEELQRRLMSGHILSEEELELIRAADRSAR